MRPVVIPAIMLSACLAVASLVRCGEDQPAQPDAAAPVTKTIAPDEQPATANTQQPTLPIWVPSADPKMATFLALAAPKPAAWIEQPPGDSTHAANYSVPGRNGDEPASLTVLSLGPDQGETIDESIFRWQAQFKPDTNGTPQQPRVERFHADNMPVTLVELAGDWMKPGTNLYTPDQLFLCAIVDAPIGNVLVRFTGRRATVEANREAFMTMIRGLHKSGDD